MLDLVNGPCRLRGTELLAALVPHKSCYVSIIIATDGVENCQKAQIYLAVLELLSASNTNFITMGSVCSIGEFNTPLWAT